MSLKTFLLTLLLAVGGMVHGFGQQPAGENEPTAYQRIANERASKIVATLGLSDPAVLARVQSKIAQQYQDLNALHEKRKTVFEKWKETLLNEAQEAEIKKQEADLEERLKKLHTNYLTNLSTDLDSQQIDKVKDGMTYGVLPITYKGYQAMLPDLTDEQKKQILAYLTEARERAMDEGSSEKKHAMFGKYKGRINNYLSAAGIDMKKASKAWEARIAEEAEKSKKQ